MDASSPSLPVDFHDPRVIADPYPVYARLRREQPLWHNPASGSWTVTRYADVRRVLDDSEFSNIRFEELFARLPASDRLSFGHGRHFCIGNGLARFEATLLFRTLLDRFASIAPAWTGEAPEWRPTLSFRCPKALPVVLRVA